MVFLNRNSSARRKAPPIPTVEATTGPRPSGDHVHTVLAMLADAGCTLRTPSGPPFPPSDPHKLRRHLENCLSADPSLLADFLSGFSSYIQNPENLRRVLISGPSDGGGDVSSPRTDSLVQTLLLVPLLQLQLQHMLLEKLSEHFGDSDTAGMVVEDDVARLVINQFRWLDFLVDSKGFTDKLLEVLSICPLQLKKDIIGLLPEIIDDQSYGTVVAALERMLQEDSEVVVPVLDSFSNLNLDDQLQEQSLSELHSAIEHSESSFSSKLNHLRPPDIKVDRGRKSECTSPNKKRKCRRNSTAPEKSDLNGKLRQPTILDTLKRAGVVISQEGPNEGSSGFSRAGAVISQEGPNEGSSGFSTKDRASQSGEQHKFESKEQGLVEISAVPKVLDAQRFKFRPLLVDCLSILSCSQIPYLISDVIQFVAQLGQQGI